MDKRIEIIKLIDEAMQAKKEGDFDRAKKCLQLAMEIEETQFQLGFPSKKTQRLLKNVCKEEERANKRKGK